MTDALQGKFSWHCNPTVGAKDEGEGPGWSAQGIDWAIIIDQIILGQVVPATGLEPVTP
jgi:hypothetical protein